MKFILKYFFIIFFVVLKNLQGCDLRIIIDSKNNEDKSCNFTFIYDNISLDCKKYNSEEEFINEVNSNIKDEINKKNEYFEDDYNENLEKKQEIEKILNLGSKSEEEKKTLQNSINNIVEKMKINENRKTLNKILKDDAFKKINDNLVFVRKIIYKKDEKEPEDIYFPKFDLDLTNVKNLKYYYTFKYEKPYNLKYYEFEIDEKSYFFKDYILKKGLTQREFHNQLREDVKTINDFLNDKKLYFNLDGLIEIIQNYIKTKHISYLLKNNFIFLHVNGDGKTNDEKYNSDKYDIGFCLKLGLKDINVKVKKGQEEYIVPCPVIGENRSPNQILKNGLKKYFLITNLQDLDKIIESINGVKYDKEKIEHIVGSLDFFDKNFVLIIKTDVKIIGELKKFKDLKEQNPIEQQKIDDLNSDDSNVKDEQKVIICCCVVNKDENSKKSSFCCIF